MFRVKICGITSAEDAQMAAAVGADAIGLNFFERSERYVNPECAIDMLQGVPRSVLRVGVFVNAASAEICEVAKRVELDFIQLHGDEPPEFLAELSEMRVIRAFRCREGLQPVRDYLDRCPRRPEAVLLDAFDAARIWWNWTDVGLASAERCVNAA